MKKQIFSFICGLILMSSMNVFADSVGLNLLDGSLSLLDSLFLIATGITIIGVALICIAFLKPEKQEIETKNDEEVSVFNQAKAEAEKKEFSVFDLPQEPATISPKQEAVLEETPDIQPKPAEEPDTVTVGDEEIPEPVAVEEEQEKEIEEPVETIEEENLAKLSLTGLNNEEVKIIPLKSQVLIGRKGSCDVVISDSAISGEHCLIITDNEAIFVEDKKSTNGTFVNGERITEKTEIKKGDILALGHMKFKIGL